jgi:hypothetical protein
MTKELVNATGNKWKVVYIKTIDNTEPIYYRIANLETLEAIDVPASRFFDELVNKKLNIINIMCRNNSIVTLDSEGYENTDEIIITDIFDKKTPSLLDWSLSKGVLGTQVMCNFDSEKNKANPSNIKIDSAQKYVWTCEKGHSIKCDIATYMGIGLECPICKLNKEDKVMSLAYWSKITNNENISEGFDNAEGNKIFSTDIAWNSKRKVYFRNETGEEKQIALNELIKLSEK